MELKKVNKVLKKFWALCQTKKEVKIIFAIFALVLGMKCMYEFGISVGEALYYVIY